MWAVIKGIFIILAQIAKVFPDMYRNYRKKKRVKWHEKIRKLKLERLALKMKLRIAIGEERENLIKDIARTNDDIMYYERLLRED